ncbi:hypothetical protein SKAU_G00225960 [Synaphobranchus kaupii]|uniref:Ig-like domain-containing protein n=1 Tax=Synaphobranchus kaupii TaxID=118154 RepID=A0A9Q1FBM2_SYNKA|nr:hypothetical protein SKAU_G00225960 [Synaphobranchus kaupii]
MNTKEAFQKVRTLIGYDSKPMPSAVTDPLSFAEDLNIFYARFDTTNCSEECRALLETLPIPEPAHPAPFTVEDVRRQLSRCKPGKPPGPNGIQARVLKECTAELAPIMHSLFWESYKTASVPTLWKTSSIIPMLWGVNSRLTLLHSLLQHLEAPRNFARLLFIDFSSAFDNIQRHQMIQKLHHFDVPPLLIHWVHSAASQRVRVEPQVESYPGETVNLRCAFADKGDLQLTQVSWIWEPTDGPRDNIAVYHPDFGPSYPPSPFTGRISFPTPSLDNPSVVISDLKMTDEGLYTCEYAIYPAGNEQATTTLIMLAKPRNTAFIVTVIAGKKPVVVARCESADGKPPAQIKWVSVVNGNRTTTLKPGADNTVTVSSEYRLVPTPADNGKDISCVISHPTQDKPQSMPLKLVIEYPPKVTIVGYDNNWYVGRTNVMLTCQATGNPVLTSVTWKVLSGRMPDAVQVKENKLMVLKVDESVNTTFVCEVKNRLGVGKDQVTVVVSGAASQRVRVDPQVESYPGETVNLRCAFADKGDLQLAQVSWIWEPTDGPRDNIAVYHPDFGPSYPPSPFTGRISFPTPSLDNPSVVISDLKMTDEGLYTCEYAIYPAGNEQATTTLIMLAKPRNTAFIVTVIAGKKPVVVARCESADGKPPAQIKWVSVVNGNGTTTLKPGADNTVTVSREYWLVPTPADNGKDISCVINPPKVTIVGYDNNWYVGRTNVMLTCQATGNPVLTSVTWKVLSGRMPDAVQVKENKLMVLKVDESVDNTFVCEVKNRLGVGKDQVTVVVSAGLLWRHILSVLVLLAAIGLLIEHFISHTPSTGIVLHQEEPRAHCTSVRSDNGSEDFIPVPNSSQGTVG